MHDELDYTQSMFAHSGSTGNNVIEMTTYLTEMVKASRGYCLLVENMGLYQTNPWLTDVSRLLTRIQAAMVHLEQPGIDTSFFALPDLEARFELYCSLKDKLGIKDEYFMESDTASEGAEKTGSLASDLADVYFEIKRGLDLIDASPDAEKDALGIWLSGYYLHWGQHLADAIRQLHRIKVESFYMGIGGNMGGFTT